MLLIVFLNPVAVLRGGGLGRAEAPSQFYAEPPIFLKKIGLAPDNYPKTATA